MKMKPFNPEILNPLTEYENYSDTSQSYDTTRQPIGLEIILGCFAATDTRPLHEQVILDAGCGTGNYLQAIHHKVGICHGIEINEGMLAQAQGKFGNGSHVKLAHGNLLNLPYLDDFFDGIMCNQVIHHLDDPGKTDGFPNVKAMLSSAYRVLRPQGVLIINICSRQQLVDGFWWADLIPQIVDKMATRIPSIELTTEMLEVARFKMGGIIVPLHEILQGPSYCDPKGPLQKPFRDGDSTWALLSEKELHQTLEHIRTMNEDGSITPFLAEREKRRHGVGQTTFIFARKE
jgi:ubiquinone/menaquinone biosynthesis C-methylase UbiE